MEDGDRDWKVIGVCCRAAAAAIANTVEEEGRVERESEREGIWIL